MAADVVKSTNKHTFYPNFDDNPLVTPEMDKRMRRHLIPLNHPAKLALDAIFNQSNALQDLESFEAAGFTTISHNTASYTRVAIHPSLQGYVIKAYLDTELRRRRGPCWQSLSERCEGAENIRNLINHKKLRHFTVPDKWLYPVPHKFNNQQDKKKRFILIATDMQLTPSAENKAAWGEHLTRRQLKELYCIFSHGYASIFLPANIPYTRHHKFACIDTEFAKRKIDYRQVRRFLPQHMLDYWEHLVQQGKKT
jgi:hypothetical protein